MAVQKMFPMDNDNKKLHGEIVNILNKVYSGEMPKDLMDEPLDFNTLYSDKEQVLSTSADFYTHSIIADEIGRQKLIEIFDIPYPETKERLAKSEWGQLFSGSTNLTKQIGAFNRELTSVQTIIEGGVPDPAKELIDKIKQERDRLSTLSIGKGEEIRNLEELLRQAEEQKSKADSGINDLESVMPELDKVSQQNLYCLRLF